jgi:hypothetical protein
MRITLDTTDVSNLVIDYIKRNIDTTNLQKPGRWVVERDYSVSGIQLAATWVPEPKAPESAVPMLPLVNREIEDTCNVEED